MSQAINLAIFASGGGTNAENICNFFAKNSTIDVVHIFSNKKNAYVLERAKKLGVPSTVFSRIDFQNANFVKKLQEANYIILAGFLWLIPEYLIEAFPNRIINIHPALLPKFGGKGMYGDRVHQAVIDAGEEESGITIHLVNERYDEGEILFQARCGITKEETSSSLAGKIHALEYEHFPKVIEEYILRSK